MTEIGEIFYQQNFRVYGSMHKSDMYLKLVVRDRPLYMCIPHQQ